MSTLAAKEAISVFSYSDKFLSWRILAKLDQHLISRVHEEEMESTELYVANDASRNDLKYLFFRIIVFSKPEAD
jgi:hypothetical protein